MKNLENHFESFFFRCRWILAPFFFGLLLAVIALLVKFGYQLITLFANLMSNSAEQSIVNILTLVDTALLASLLLIIAFSGYENFVSKFPIDEHEDRPAWMGKVGFSDLKLKLIGAIVAISAVELLKVFINIQSLPTETVAWKVGIHITFVISSVMFALTDFIVEKGKRTKATDQNIPTAS